MLVVVYMLHDLFSYIGLVLALGQGKRGRGKKAFLNFMVNEVRLFTLLESFVEKVTVTIAVCINLMYDCIPENDNTWMLCRSIPLSWPGFVFTTILSLPFILSGPYSAKTALQFLRLPHSYANIPSEHSNCSVFRSSQWRVHRFTSHNSSSRRNSKSSLTPFHLKY